MTLIDPHRRPRHALRRLALLVILAALPTFAIGAANAPVADDPTRGALADFDFVTARVAANYAGWPGKTSGDRAADLAALTARLRADVERDGESALRPAVDAWLAWFEDGHLQARWLAGASLPAWGQPRRAMTESAMRAAWGAASTRDPIEAVWSIDATYRLGVVARADAPGAFDAVVLSTTAEGWAPGDVKATLEARGEGRYAVRYGTLDRSTFAFDAELRGRGDVLDVGELGVWRKEAGSREGTRAAMRRWPGDDFILERLDAGTLYLRLPSFHESHLDTVRALLESNAEALASTPRLVVDVRHNGGGSDHVYAPLLPWILSGPITRIGVELRVSDDNRRLRADTADRLATVLPDASRLLRAESERMAGLDGGFLRREPAREIVDVGPPRTNPARVAILVDGAQSSAENLLLDARQSRKVVLMGQAPSYGVIDHGEMMAMAAPSGRFELAWATTRSLRLPADPVDPHGISPQAWIPLDVDDPVAEAARHLERDALR